MKFKITTFLFCVGIVFSSYGQGQSFSYKDGADPLSGYLAKTKSTRKAIPGVVIIPAWMGVNEHTDHTADQLAASGYHALVADIYGEGKNPKNTTEARELSNYYKNNPVVYQRRIKAAIDALVKQGADPSNIAVIGYCFGGTGALEAARGGLPVKGVVSIHGGLGKDTTRAHVAIAPKVLVLHGADDPYVPQAQVSAFQQEMRAGKADWQMIYYANAVHAFTEPAAGNDNSKGAAYNELAAKRSWEHLQLFLMDLFK
jgi:dienelactone hydrolase